MRAGLKTAVARAFAAVGGLRRLHAGKLVVLTFHRVRAGGEGPERRAMRSLDVAAGDFRRMLEWMRERYEPLALGEWVGSGGAPGRASFAVTFDDGWMDNHEHAYPVLRELGIPATIFLATGAVEDRTPFWWQMPGLSDAEIEQLKRRKRPEIESRIEGHPDFRKAHANDFLTWEQVREMGGSGLVTFGAHGHRHELMTMMTREEAAEDVRRCWSLLREKVPGALAPALAWPNGDARGDLGEALGEMGIVAAFGTGRGAISAAAGGCWSLPRNNIDRNVSQNPGLLPWVLMRTG